MERKQMYTPTTAVDLIEMYESASIGFSNVESAEILICDAEILICDAEMLICHVKIPRCGTSS